MHFSKFIWFDLKNKDSVNIKIGMFQMCHLMTWEPKND